MPSPAARFTILFIVALATPRLATAQKSQVVAHEWGTFTTVAGPSGHAVEWIPLGGPVDLPCFVNVFGANSPGVQLLVKVPIVTVRPATTGGSFAPSGAPAIQAPPPIAGAVPGVLTYDQARTQIRGTVRMETPVIYFYSPREAVVDVGVDFPKGYMSEWYPSAVVTQPPAQRIPLDSNLHSNILWKNVAILPGTAPAYKTEAGRSHYYAARETDANPIRVNGQNEKFLFYRGVGGFQVPIVATEQKDGTISVRNTGKVPVPAVVLFENRDGKIGYRMVGSLKSEAQLMPVTLTSDIASLARDLEAMLVDAGMYKREAQAMVETWRDSWFEEGARLFYVMPKSTVDGVLPLSIIPTPASVERAFVGRLEIITNETIRRVSDALDAEDEEMLLRYGRFLGPITDRIMEGASAKQVSSTKLYVNALFSAFVAKSEKTCK